MRGVPTRLSVAARFFRGFVPSAAAPFTGTVYATVAVAADDRLVSIGPWPRLVRVAAEDRLVFIDPEDRTLSVPLEDRTVPVPAGS